MIVSARSATTNDRRLLSQSPLWRPDRCPRTWGNPCRPPGGTSAAIGSPGSRAVPRSESGSARRSGLVPGQAKELLGWWRTSCGWNVSHQNSTAAELVTSRDPYTFWLEIPGRVDRLVQLANLRVESGSAHGNGLVVEVPNQALGHRWVGPTGPRSRCPDVTPSSCSAIWRSGLRVTTTANAVIQRSVTSARSTTSSSSFLPLHSQPWSLETCLPNRGNPSHTR